jgi:hypothetical protein
MGWLVPGLFRQVSDWTLKRGERGGVWKERCTKRVGVRPLGWPDLHTENVTAAGMAGAGARRRPGRRPAR